MAAMHESYFFVVAVAGSYAWPNESVCLEYCGNRFRLIPPDKDRYANVVLELPPGTIPVGGGLEIYDQHLTIMNRFLSALSWVDGVELRIHGRGIGRNRPLLVKGVAYAPTTQHVPNGLWLPEVVDVGALRALGLMREARAAQHMFPSVAFLWFYKAIETCFGWRYQDTDPFFNRCFARLKADALVGYQAWKAKGPKFDSFGSYMREHRRNSVAHGFDPPSVDPDSAHVLRELASELPLICELATIAIKERFGVPGLAELVENGRKSEKPAGWVPLEKIEAQP